MKIMYIGRNFVPLLDCICFTRLRRFCAWLWSFRGDFWGWSFVVFCQLGYLFYQIMRTRRPLVGGGSQLSRESCGLFEKIGVRQLSLLVINPYALPEMPCMSAGEIPWITFWRVDECLWPPWYSLKKTVLGRCYPHFFQVPSPHTAFAVSAGSPNKPTKHYQFDIAVLEKKKFHVTYFLLKHFCPTLIYSACIHRNYVSCDCYLKIHTESWNIPLPRPLLRETTINKHLPWVSGRNSVINLLF